MIRIKGIAGLVAYIAVDASPTNALCRDLGGNGSCARTRSRDRADGRGRRRDVPVTSRSLVQASLVTTPVPAPANDERANAQVVHSLPATINGTTVGATLEAGEAESACGVPTVNSVWYSLRAQSR